MPPTFFLSSCGSRIRAFSEIWSIRVWLLASILVTTRNATLAQSQLIAQTTPDKAHAAIKAIYKEVAHFNDKDYYTDEQLESAKALLEADDLYSREKLSDYTHTLSFWWASTGLEYFRGYLPRLARNFARRHQPLHHHLHSGQAAHRPRFDVERGASEDQNSTGRVNRSMREQIKRFILQCVGF